MCTETDNTGGSASSSGLAANRAAVPVPPVGRKREVSDSAVMPADLRQRVREDLRKLMISANADFPADAKRLAAMNLEPCSFDDSLDGESLELLNESPSSKPDKAEHPVLVNEGDDVALGKL